eukprot:TRINITY_DN96114_c0_g1_i1.p1 TRINITY_DN96114_c0_g1~~TRINITY_DN96114_c0_g1_i1.p1  ORF type:complete len:694 (-),score=109.19 TRINITY_DN96114_c0_g1_i1:45-2096(-)
MAAALTSQRFQELLGELAACHLEELASVQRTPEDEALSLLEFAPRAVILPGVLPEKDKVSAQPDPEVWVEPNQSKLPEDTEPVSVACLVKVVDEDKDLQLNEQEDSSSQRPSMSGKRFPLRDLWAMSVSEGSRGVLGTLAIGRGNADGQTVDADYDLGLEGHPACEGANEWWAKFIALPGSHYRLGWDMLGGFLIMYDLFTIPLRVFDPPDSPFTVGMDWTTLLFWTLNVFTTLTAGYISQGVIVIHPKKILIAYLKSWFIVDLVVLVPDWTFTMLSISANSDAGETGDSVKVLRSLRLARTIRLLRLLKLKWILDTINDYLDSEYSSIILSIVRMLVTLLILSHFIACLWFLIAAVQKDTAPKTWLTNGYESIPWEDQYLTALHWAVTQFTPASMRVQPENAAERKYAIFVVLFALVGFAYVVGSITGSLTQLRSMSEQMTKDFWLLRRFLKKNDVERTLALRITRFVEHAYARQQKTMAMSQVKVLNILSKQLMEELQCSINLPHMKIHPLFKFLSTYSVITMNRVAKDSVSRRHIARGDTLFQADERAACLYFVASGRIRYVRLINDKEVEEYVDSGEDWMSEPILWTAGWFHVGEAKAHTDSELLMISPKSFEEILSLVKTVAAIVSEYGRRFMAYVESNESLNDVVQGDEVGELIRDLIPGDAETTQLEHNPHKRAWE